MCVKPKPIRNPNTGEIYLVPCGKCIQCKRAYQNEWIFRLSEEMKHCQIPLFVTLTYNNEHLPLGDDSQGITHSVLCKRDVQLFLKRLRKTGVFGKFRYFAIGEYGTKSTIRPHYHLVIMPKERVEVNLASCVIAHCWTEFCSKKNGVEIREPIGFVKVKFCTQQQVHYVCKYMNKLDSRWHLVKPFRLYSKGLGLCYLSLQMIKYYLSTCSRTCRNGSCDISLPRYYRRKLDAQIEMHPYMSKTGYNYNSLVNDVLPLDPKPHSQYWWFREFQKTLQRYSDLQTKAESEFGEFRPIYNYREIYENLYKQVPELCNLKLSSDLKIETCVIKNGLGKKNCPATFDEYDNLLILRE